MADWFSSIVNALKPGLPLYVAAATTGLIFLFLPAAAIKWLGAEEVAIQYRWAFSLAFVFFGVLSICYGTIWVRTTRAGRDTLEFFMGFVTSYVVRRQFDQLNAKEKYLILRVVESHQDYFFYPRYADTIQTLADKGWVDCEFIEVREGTRFRIRWDKWLALKRIRAHVRAERGRFSDADKAEIAKVINALEGRGER